MKEAVTGERLAEDMELELVEVFPKQSDLRLQAVRLLMYLEESGPKKQSELVEEFLRTTATSWQRVSIARAYW